MILLHGGLGSGEMFAPILPALTERHQVIAPDLQGTAGRPTSISRRSRSFWLLDNQTLTPVLDVRMQWGGITDLALLGDGLSLAMLANHSGPHERLMVIEWS